MLFAVDAAASTIITLANTLVSGDREPAQVQAQTQGQTTAAAVYTRGQSEFAQTLEKVDTDPQVLEALKEAGTLANANPGLTALLQVSSAQATTQFQTLEQATSPTPVVNGVAALQQSLTNGAAQLYQSSRLGLTLNTVG